MNYGIYIINGRDSVTGGEASLSLRADSVPSAVGLAGERGVKPETVESPTGVLYRVQADGGLRENADTAAVPVAGSDPDMPLKIIALLIPVVGVIAGAIRLGLRDRSGAAIIGWAVGGFVLWTLLGAMVL